MTHPINIIGDKLVAEINKSLLQQGEPTIDSMSIDLRHVKSASHYLCLPYVCTTTPPDSYVYPGWFGTLNINKHSVNKHKLSLFNTLDTKIVGEHTRTHIQSTHYTGQYTIVLPDLDHPVLLEYMKQQHGEKVAVAILTNTEVPGMHLHCEYHYRGIYTKTSK